MKIKVGLTFLISMQWSYFFGQQKMTFSDLKFKIDDLLRHCQRNFAVAFKDVQTGKTLLINEHEKFHAACTMKTPVVVEVFKQSANGNFSLDDSLVLTMSSKALPTAVNSVLVPMMIIV